MIARHEGRVVFVSGAIPGERVRARVEHVKGGIAYATVTRVETASPDRREPRGDPACGGSVYAHIAYDRQTALKGEIIVDAFRRIGRVTLDAPVPVRPSPEEGYRMRARLHVRGSRIGFFREGSHSLCEPEATGQLLPATGAFLQELSARLRAADVLTARELELTENVPASERAVLVELMPGPGAMPHAVLPALDLPAATGVLVVRPDAPDRNASRGRPSVRDVLEVAQPGGPVRFTIRRHVLSFFQGNRYLLQPLIEGVAARVPAGPVVDLYAGAGLFGLACAALGRGPVVAVEGDRHGAQDLKDNAQPFGDTVRVVASAVEPFLSRDRLPEFYRIYRDGTAISNRYDRASATASAGAAWTRAPSRTSRAPYAMARASGVRCPQRGATRWRAENPMFFIARAAAPMLPGCSGRTSTTRTRRVHAVAGAGDPVE